jgi:hypothetical protein
MIDCLAEELDCNDFGTSICQEETQEYNECQGPIYDEEFNG